MQIKMLSDCHKRDIHDIKLYMKFILIYQSLLMVFSLFINSELSAKKADNTFTSAKFQKMLSPSYNILRI